MTITIGSQEQIASAEKIAADMNSLANRNIAAAEVMIANAPAAMTLEHRRAAQAPMVLPSDDAVVDAAVRVRNIEAFGFDPQSLDRLRRGLGPTSSRRPARSPVRGIATTRPSHPPT